MLKQSEVDVQQLIRDNTVNQQLTCAVAHQLSQQYGLSLAEIGRVADSLGIKISKCQLGCF
jgi:hypothetical protein